MIYFFHTYKLFLQLQMISRGIMYNSMLGIAFSALLINHRFSLL